ncbi:MAG: TauD/TfdA family dioxygenase [Acidimicrobiales bacterium]|nr:TauD/TfdA family dioxygenase [Acidimicrobiales bacterium]
MKLTPLGPCIGVSVTDIEPRQLGDSDTAAALGEALETHGVLVFPELHCDDASQVAFGKALGEPDVFPIPTGDHAEIFLVTLDPAKNPAASYLQGTFFWHIDGATDDVPNMATMLNAVGVADNGGGTEFCSTYASWDALSADDKAKYKDLRVVHSMEASQRLVYSDPTEAQVADWQARPSKEQPLAWTHESGRTSLVLGATTDHIVGMNRDEGRQLIDHLEAWATDERFVYHHDWTVGDLVMWDNRGTMHRALPYDADSPRLMHRVTLAGDEAFA